MKVIYTNFWDVYKNYDIALITTNGYVTRTGHGVMGAGIAKQAMYQFPNITKKLGTAIRVGGNKPMHLIKNLYSFPVKHHWSEDGDPELIRESCKEVVEIANRLKAEKILLPMPGCGNGRLDYVKDVEPILNEELDERFTIIDRTPPIFEESITSNESKFRV